MYSDQTSRTEFSTVPDSDEEMDEVLEDEALKKINEEIQLLRGIVAKREKGQKQVEEEKKVEDDDDGDDDDQEDNDDDEEKEDGQDEEEDVGYTVSQSIFFSYNLQFQADDDRPQVPPSESDIELLPPAKQPDTQEFPRARKRARISRHERDSKRVPTQQDQ